MIRKAGSTWKIVDVRKVPLTVKLHEDVCDDDADGWFNADLEEGKPSYISNEARLGPPFALEQPVAGRDAMSFRKSLVRWIEEVPTEGYGH